MVDNAVLDVPSEEIVKAIQRDGMMHCVTDEYGNDTGEREYIDPSRITFRRTSDKIEMIIDTGEKT